MKPSFNFCFYEQFRLNIHTDSLYDDNLNKWIIGKYPYNENRPAKITQEYGRWMLGDSTEATLMSPYGGTIYVIIYGDADCEVTIDGAIDMPYFIQGRNVWIDVSKYRKFL